MLGYVSGPNAPNWTGLTSDTCGEPATVGEGECVDLKDLWGMSWRGFELLWGRVAGGWWRSNGTRVWLKSKASPAEKSSIADPQLDQPGPKCNSCWFKLDFQQGLMLEAQRLWSEQTLFQKSSFFLSFAAAFDVGCGVIHTWWSRWFPTIKVLHCLEWCFAEIAFVSQVCNYKHNFPSFTHQV